MNFLLPEEYKLQLLLKILFPAVNLPATYQKSKIPYLSIFTNLLKSPWSLVSIRSVEYGHIFSLVLV